MSGLGILGDTIRIRLALSKTANAAAMLDEKRMKQIGYQLELKCRDVEF